MSDKMVRRIVARFVSATNDEDPLYHVTHYNRLSDIASDGLQPGRSRSIGGAAYDEHAKGRIFLTEADGVRFWYGKSEDFAEHNSDNPYEEGLVPVVLRVDIAGIVDDELDVDEDGTADSSVDAWMASEGIDPEYIQVYTGKKWVPVDRWEEIDPKDAFDVDENSDDSEDPLYYFKSDSPLLPKL